MSSFSSSRSWSGQSDRTGDSILASRLAAERVTSRHQTLRGPAAESDRSPPMLGHCVMIRRRFCRGCFITPSKAKLLLSVAPLVTVSSSGRIQAGRRLSRWIRDSPEPLRGPPRECGCGGCRTGWSSMATWHPAPPDRSAWWRGGPDRSCSEVNHSFVRFQACSPFRIDADRMLPLSYSTPTGGAGRFLLFYRSLNSGRRVFYLAFTAGPNALTMAESS